MGVHPFMPCIVAGIQYDVSVAHETEIIVTVTGAARRAGLASCATIADVSRALSVRFGGPAPGVVLKDSPPKPDSESETESDSESAEPRDARRAAAPVARSATTSSVTAPFFPLPPAGRASRTSSAGGRSAPSSQPGSRAVSRAPSAAVRVTSSGGGGGGGGDDSGLLFDMEGVGSSGSGSGSASAARSLVGSSSNATELEDLADEHVEITPLDFIPGGRVVNYRDRLALTLVKETYSISEAGGMGAFCHAALIEAQVRCADHLGRAS